jgi:ribosome-binding protein aMBF1 (putative translation factor)
LKSVDSESSFFTTLDGQASIYHQRDLQMKKSGLELRRILAHNIRTLRRQKGLSQEELAHLCGLHRTYIGSIERAERNATLSTLDTLASTLNVSVADLLTKGEVDDNEL